MTDTTTPAPDGGAPVEPLTLGTPEVTVRSASLYATVRLPFRAVEGQAFRYVATTRLHHSHSPSNVRALIDGHAGPDAFETELSLERWDLPWVNLDATVPLTGHGGKWSGLYAAAKRLAHRLGYEAIVATVRSESIGDVLRAERAVQRAGIRRLLRLFGDLAAVSGPHDNYPMVDRTQRLTASLAEAQARAAQTGDIAVRLGLDLDGDEDEEGLT